jgi:hypothetical protein
MTTRRPIDSHRFHDLSDAQLQYILRDAHEAALCMRGLDDVAECKYLDQVNDAATVLHYRKNLERKRDQQAREMMLRPAA